MPLHEQLTQDLKTAMKNKDQVKLTTIRQIRATMKNREIEVGHELNEEELLKVIATLVKQHKDSIEQFQQGGRDDLVAKEQAELTILEAYLPQAMSAEEIAMLLTEAIAAVQATSAKDLGKVMKYLMPKTQGRVDGKLLNQLVKQRLG